MSKSYAFIGLGHLGGNLAASLIRNGFAVTVFDRDPAAAERLVALG
ncbi:NAD(P)-dependent oxidoreductase, partial [Mesorhizobium sp. AD1-1]